MWAPTIPMHHLPAIQTWGNGGMGTRGQSNNKNMGMGVPTIPCPFCRPALWVVVAAANSDTCNHHRQIPPRIAASCSWVQKSSQAVQDTTRSNSSGKVHEGDVERIFPTPHDDTLWTVSYLRISTLLYPLLFFFPFFSFFLSLCGI